LCLPLIIERVACNGFVANFEKVGTRTWRKSWFVDPMVSSCVVRLKGKPSAMLALLHEKQRRALVAAQANAWSI